MIAWSRQTTLAPLFFLGANQATSFGAGLGSNPLRKSSTETDNTETQRREDDELCHGETPLSDPSRYSYPGVLRFRRFAV